MQVCAGARPLTWGGAWVLLEGVTNRWKAEQEEHGGGVSKQQVTALGGMAGLGC